ncbi:MAG: CDP-alcohol phosphatidyltransferase family protein [Spirochaetia bacterium]
MKKSIILNSLLFFLFQSLFFLIFTLIYSFGTTIWISFYAVNILLHTVLAVFLTARRRDFVLIPEEIQLKKINTANQLTIFRISSVPVITYLLLLSDTYPVVVPLLIITTLAFVSDYLDGQISRRTHQTTRIGQYLDSMGDYTVLLVLSIAFVYHDLVSLWFFILLLSRLVFLWAGMGFLMLYRGKPVTGSTVFGKVSIFAAMFVYAAAVLKLFPDLREFAAEMVYYLQITAGILIAVSIIDKAVYLRTEFLKIRNVKREQYAQSGN